MSRELKKRLSEAIEQIEKMEAQVTSTKSYSSEVEKLRMLIEMIKEQVTNENTSNSAR